MKRWQKKLKKAGKKLGLTVGFVELEVLSEDRQESKGCGLSCL